MHAVAAAIGDHESKAAAAADTSAVGSTGSSSPLPFSR